MAITAIEARKRLFPLIRQVNDDRIAIEIVSNHGRAYLVAAEDYESTAETDYLLHSPANASRLMSAAEEVRRGRSLIAKTMDGSPRRHRGSPSRCAAISPSSGPSGLTTSIASSTAQPTMS